MKIIVLALLALGISFAADPPKPEPPSLSDAKLAAYYLAQWKLAQAKLDAIEAEKQRMTELQTASQTLTASCPGAQAPQRFEVVCPQPAPVAAKETPKEAPKK